MACSPVGLLCSSRVRRKSMIPVGTPPATASGSIRVFQIRSTSARSSAGPVPSSSASSALSTAARGPLSAPGPELISVSELIRAAPASSTSRATRPPREWPSRWMPRGGGPSPAGSARPEPSQSAIMPTSAASASS